MTDKQVIHLAVPDTQDNAMTTASQALVAYPNVKKWMIVACNDNGVLGVVRALEQAGYPADDMIGVGINGQIACEEFKKPQATGFKGSIFVDSRVHGATAIRELYANVTKGEPIPARTIIEGHLITQRRQCDSVQPLKLGRVPPAGGARNPWEDRVEHGLFRSSNL